LVFSISFSMWDKPRAHSHWTLENSLLPVCFQITN
jgi:hypothetical protein